MKSLASIGSVAVALLASLFLSSCATLATGSKDNVTFNSNPEGARVSVNGRVLGTTPITLDLKKKSGQQILFEKDGYKPAEMPLKTKINGWFFGNVIIGGLVGSTTDAASGSIYRYSPSEYMVTLEPLTASVPIESGTELTRQQKVKDFIVTGYPQLLKDINAGEGEYLTSLMDLLDVPKDKRADAKARMTVLSATYNNAPEFADNVSALAWANTAQ